MHPETRELIVKANGLKDQVFQTIFNLMPPGNAKAKEAFTVWQHAAEMEWKHPGNADVKRCAEEARAEMVAAYGGSK